jgi:hypothetical protein
MNLDSEQEWDNASSVDTMTTEVTVQICNLCETQLSTEYNLYMQNF